MRAGGAPWFQNEVIRGRRALPAWLQIAFMPIAVLVVFETAARRGWAWGAVAGLSYGYIAIANSVARNRVRQWRMRRSERGNYLLCLLLLAALFFVALAPVRGLSTAACAAVSVLAGGTTVGLVWVLRGRFTS